MHYVFCLAIAKGPDRWTSLQPIPAFFLTCSLRMDKTKERICTESVPHRLNKTLVFNRWCHNTVLAFLIFNLSLKVDLIFKLAPPCTLWHIYIAPFVHIHHIAPLVRSRKPRTWPLASPVGPFYINHTWRSNSFRHFAQDFPRRVPIDKHDQKSLITKNIYTGIYVCSVT